MNPMLLALLVCPLCSGRPLRLHAEVKAGEKVERGRVECDCGHVMRIEDFVLDAIGDEAAVEDQSVLYDALWDAHVPQAYAGRETEYVRKFSADTGMTGDLAAYFAGKTVLDAGCGEGRFTFLASALGASHVVAVDASRQALRRAVNGTGNPDNCSFLRADLTNLPLEGEFDYVFSLGVLHHTPSTRETLERLLHLLKDGGYVSIWVYGAQVLPRVYRVARPLTLRLRADRVRAVLDALGYSYDPKVKPRVDLRRLARRAGRFDVLGLHALTFEGLTTPFLWSHRREEAEQWFRECGIEVIASSDDVFVSGKRRPRASAPA
jgi:SAM-dependent methyltransferase